VSVAEPSVAAAPSVVSSRPRRGWFWIGPAFVASMAYVDPGNFGTNFVAGNNSGYQLVWVVVLANGIAMFVQALSSKLGLATQLSLADNCRLAYPRRTVWLLWAQSEVMAVGTDVAEIVGGAIALHLLFGLPVSIGGVITAAAAVLILTMQTHGRRPFEVAVVVFILVVVSCLAFVAWSAPIDAAAATRGLSPDLSGHDSFLLATGILGATVMPHVVYLHSSLVAELGVAATDQRRRILRLQRGEIVVALGLAGAANLVMLLVAASTRRTGPRSGNGNAGNGNASLDHVHHVLGQALGHPAATAFALALLASGLASASVGTLAGQQMMQGFLGRSIPLSVRRGATLVPALAILNLGLDPTTVLVLSQVVLSIALPFALVPLLLLTRNAALMGDLRNRRRTTATAWAVSTLVVSLNVTAVVAAVSP
jgi:manganese transport protein